PAVTSTRSRRRAAEERAVGADEVAAVAQQGHRMILELLQRGPRPDVPQGGLQEHADQLDEADDLGGREDGAVAGQDQQPRVVRAGDAVAGTVGWPPA